MANREFMMEPNKEQPQLVNGETKVCRHRINEIAIFEVSESELEQLEKGNSADLFLQFSISLLSIAVSITLSMLTATFNNKHLETVFISLCIISYILGILLMALWYKSHFSIRKLIQKIRKRPQS